MNDRPITLSRRRWLAATALSPFTSLALAGSGAPERARLVFIVLRGGMDGLFAVPAPGDPAFASARGPLAGWGTPALALDGTFSLHPNLQQMHSMFGAGELAVVHAVGLPYRERSHFDAQQLLESGGTRPHQLLTGWLGRALATGGQRGVALNTAVPLLLRGGSEIDTWAPSALPEPTPDLVARLATMYRDDPALGAALARARDLRKSPEMADGAGMGMATPGNRNGAVALARKAAEWLAAPEGPSVAVLELGGWDSHANQAAPQGATAGNLRTLDTMFGTLRDTLAAPEARGAWGRTVIVAASEFGREVAANGTLGTDHGTGGAAFVAGGAVAGGRVFADWPGLAPAQRFEGRDLRITTDLRAVLRPLLAQHLAVPRSTLDGTVLPGSAGLRELPLLRT